MPIFAGKMHKMINDLFLDKAVSDLFQNIEFQDAPTGLYDPLRYMVAIGGKRIRPRLCLTTYSLYKQEFTPSILQPAETTGPIEDPKVTVLFKIGRASCRERV